MAEDTESEFGRYRPNAFFRGLLSLAQRSPRNEMGRQFAQFFKFIFLAFLRPPYDVEVGSLRMRCHVRDNYTEKKFVFTPWRLDLREREFLVEALGPDGVFVDIGANVGIYTLTAATHLSERGRILSLEPNPTMCGRLCFNLAATRRDHADWPQVDALSSGISDREGTFVLSLDTRNLGESSIVPDADGPASGKESEGIEIHCRPLATVLEEKGIERVDVLKIDIEGAEDLALCPYLEVASTDCLPRLIIIENSDHLWKRDVREMLLNRGYREHFRSRSNTVFRFEGR